MCAVFGETVIQEEQWFCAWGGSEFECGTQCLGVLREGFGERRDVGDVFGRDLENAGLVDHAVLLSRYLGGDFLPRASLTAFVGRVELGFDPFYRRFVVALMQEIA